MDEIFLTRAAPRSLTMPVLLECSCWVDAKIKCHLFSPINDMQFEISSRVQEVYLIHPFKLIFKNMFYF